MFETIFDDVPPRVHGHQRPRRAHAAGASAGRRAVHGDARVVRGPVFGAYKRGRVHLAPLRAAPDADGGGRGGGRGG